MVSPSLLMEARSLVPEDRQLLIQELQLSLEEDAYRPSDGEADAMAARVRAYDAGRMTAMPWDEFKVVMDEEFRS